MHRHTPLGSGAWRTAVTSLLVATLVLVAPTLSAHIVPPEKLHPVAESYRRLNFLLNLSPVPWSEARLDLQILAEGLEGVDREASEAYSKRVARILSPWSETSEAVKPPGPQRERSAARSLFEVSTQAVAKTLEGHLEAAQGALRDHRGAVRELETARQIWAAFEPTVRSTDRPAFQQAGRHWLQLSDALGSPGILGVGVSAAKPETFRESAEALADYLQANYGDSFEAIGRTFAPLPAHSPTFDRRAPLPVALPPGAQIGKQLPRPRQVLNMSQRGVDERQTPLIAFGDMAFDSPLIFGDPARSLALSCNSCHNKSITNPTFFVPGLSTREGGLDVSNSFFAPHANNGHFDPVDIPDLRGLRFTAPYGRNGRFESLREFTRNVIVNEFNGPEPDPILLDGLVAYMTEFDFLPNPLLRPDGRLAPSASVAAKRGEEIFHRPFEQMAGRSCASCHVPSDHFLDRKRHDIGSVAGASEASRDGALDTPTLLSSRFTAPYFHDGSLPTLGAVNRWFNEEFDLNLEVAEVESLTAYLETIGGGVDPYEDTLYTLEAELEEFDFFLSAYEFLAARGKPRLIDTTLQTIAFEIRAHKWDLQDAQYLPVLDRMAELMDEAYEANRKGELAGLEERLAEYRRLYQEHLEVLR